MSVHKTSLRNRQEGMVAIVVTMVLMIVISLTTLGFAHTTRLQQRNTLDRQLSSQAYYAAESGVNYAEGAIAAKLAGGGTITDKTTCDDPGALSLTDYKQYAGLSSTAKITCLLVSNKLDYLTYQNVGLDAFAAALHPTTAIDTIGISWTAPGVTGAGGCVGATTLPTNLARSSNPTNCKQPMLRVDLVPLATPDISHTMTFFLSPSNAGGSSVGFAAGSQGIKSVKCNPPATSELKECTATITGVSGDYGIRVMSIYGTSNVVLYASQGGTYKLLKDGQIVVDSTAKSVDILRRVQVRFSPTQDSNDDSSPFALTVSKGICKRFIVAASGISVVLPTTVPAASAAICNLP